MFRRRLIVGAAVLALSCVCCFAGIRSAGKYSGVVIFDRWGGCTLYSGIYVMYIAEDIKQQLKAEAGKCIQVDATQVEQRMNPGDGLIKQLTVLGPAPAMPPWESPAGLKIAVAPAFQNGQPPAFNIRVENTSQTPVTLRTDALAPTLLAETGINKLGRSPAYGPAVAVVTRQSFWVGSEPRLKSAELHWPWQVTQPRTFEKEIELQPKQAFEISLLFTLPAGEYEFLAGYGGGTHAGQCAASNLIAFDVQADGTAKLAKVVGR
jgi:hypothetical protein